MLKEKQLKYSKGRQFCKKSNTAVAHIRQLSDIMREKSFPK
jgi:hypothetical protein